VTADVVMKALKTYVNNMTYMYRVTLKKMKESTGWHENDDIKL